MTTAIQPHGLDALASLQGAVLRDMEREMKITHRYLGDGVFEIWVLDAEHAALKACNLCGRATAGGYWTVQPSRWVCGGCFKVEQK